MRIVRTKTRGTVLTVLGECRDKETDRVLLLTVARGRIPDGTAVPPEQMTQVAPEWVDEEQEER